MISDFDNAAADYDSYFTTSKIGLAQRAIIYKNLDGIFKSKKRLDILELNCGTGYDAIAFKKSGHNVIATDISEKMIAVAKSKQDSNTITFKTQDINSIKVSTFDKKFDIIFSNFGGLNCLSAEELEQFFKTSVSLLKPNGKIITVIMPKQCLWERFYFSLKADFKKAKRRQTNQAVLANLEGVKVKTWYYNPKDIIALTKNSFTINKIKPVGLAIPPSYLEHSFLTRSIIFNILKKTDTILTASRYAKYADHFLIELKPK
ncbi:class I SAM-dependent methyltransferase [Lacinutrix jangbogonensis]|uniref:class I SAM-dependent methyltransferase n=1 Tax=Lacinutrix jangbogonensis TaxID=1469557 RepID=UPI00053E92A6|nr:class I SAM-dependent methyltransferase [Lacinutrix jangbogonensis]